MASRNKKCKRSSSPIFEKFQSKLFEKVCGHVSQNAYCNYTDRLQVLDLPNCSDNNNCKHISKTTLQTINDEIRQIPPSASNTILIQVSGNTWHEAIEIIFLCITPKQYLTANILSHIVDIMLNAHDRKSSKYTVSHLIYRCQQALAYHFRTHPPCFIHENIINIYQKFIMEDAGQIEKRLSNRSDYGWNKGIIKYCFNRLEYEVSSESKDGPLLNKDEIIPRQLKNIDLLHFEREEMEIFELLERTERIERLMAVLSSLIELFQFDLLISKSRGKRTKSLMQELFLKEELINKGTRTVLRTQIMKMFAYFIHLDYPEEHIDTMTIWLNTVVEFQYYSDDNHRDYPNIHGKTRNFADQFYKIISVLPHKSILKILQRIQPNYMKYEVSLNYIQSVLNYKMENVLLHFFENSLWNSFRNIGDDENLLEIPNKTYVPLDNIIGHLSKICKTAPKIDPKETPMYPKFHPCSDTTITRNIIISAIHTCIDSHMEAYSLKNVHDIFEQINNSQSGENKINFEISHLYYVTSENRVAYERLYGFLEELSSLLKDLRKKNNLPKEVQSFENIPWLKLVQK